MDMLRGQVVINRKNEALLANDIINEVQFVIYYFSASWCPPCEKFLPLVKELNEEIGRRQLLMQIFYVPSDHDQNEMYQFYSKNHGQWYAVPVGPVTEKIRNKYHVFSIPALVVVAKDGRVVTRTGRKQLEDQGVGVLLLWFPDLAEELRVPPSPRQLSQPMDTERN